MSPSAWPSQYTSPESGRSSAPNMFNRVDLPLPLGPMMATYSPRRIAMLTSRRALIWPSGYVLPVCSVRKRYLLVSIAGEGLRRQQSRGAVSGVQAADQPDHQRHDKTDG